MISSKPIRLPLDDIKGVINDLKSGRTVAEITGKWHISTRTFYRIKYLEKLPTKDIYTRGDSHWPCVHSEEKIRAIVAERKKGVLLKDLSAKYGVAQSYISSIMNGHKREQTKWTRNTKKSRN
jgi:hypothetical protein